MIDNIKIILTLYYIPNVTSNEYFNIYIIFVNFILVNISPILKKVQALKTLGI
jgi:hypothetical protein